MGTKLTRHEHLLGRLHNGAAAAIIAGAAIITAALPVARAGATGNYLQNGVSSVVAGGFPGAWAVDSNGLRGAAGVANIGTGQPTHPAMADRIGSLTKTFVGTVALQLVSEHKLGLNDKINSYLPAGTLPNADDVTVKQVLQHTSGLPDYWESGTDPLVLHFVSDPSYRTLTWTPQQLLARISSQPLDFTPGTQAEYSDTNYIVVGMIIQKITGHTTQAEVINRILVPLHLTHTSFPITSSNIPFFHAEGYSYDVDADGNPIVTPLPQLGADPSRNFTQYNPSALGTMGAMISTPADLVTFYKALLGGQLLPHNPDPTKDMNVVMKQTVPLHQEGWPEGIGMGLGIWSWDLSAIDPSCHKTIYGHEGEVPGYDTWAFATGNGSKAIAMDVNLMIPDWDAYVATELPTYISLWCN